MSPWFMTPSPTRSSKSGLSPGNFITKESQDKNRSRGHKWKSSAYWLAPLICSACFLIQSKYYPHQSLIKKMLTDLLTYYNLICHVLLMFLNPLAPIINPFSSSSVGFPNLIQCLALCFCTCPHKLLDGSSLMTTGSGTNNLVTEDNQFGLLIHYC